MTVRIVVTDKQALGLIDRELRWVMTDPVPDPGATVYLIQDDNVDDFFVRVMGMHQLKEIGDFNLISVSDESGKLYGGDAGTRPIYYPYAQHNREERTIHIADGDDYYFVTESYRPEDWIQKGHIAVQLLFRALNTRSNSCLVHGACVGLEGKGILMCARGNMGKSTLAVTAMLDGFEYVSEDYLVLEKEESGGLFASPVYSIITLSPRMYNNLYDKMDMARFVGISHFKGKYVFDMYSCQDRLRRHYPVRACLFPEISPEATEPSVVPLNLAEKGRAITHIAHSTLFQMWSKGLKQKQNDQETIIKIIGMVRDMDFYKIILTPDIHSNAECLRSFVLSLD